MMRDNSAHVKKVQQSKEVRTTKEGRLPEPYNQEFQKFLDNKVLVPVTEEDKKYKGPVHYLTYFAVLNPGSSSTSLRIVADFAFPKVLTKLSLNDCIKAGPNALNDILHVILR